MALGVLRNEGVRGFWRGNGLNILRTAPYKVGAAALSASFCAPLRPRTLWGQGPRWRRLQLSGDAPVAPQAVNFSSYDAYRKLMQLRNGGEHLGRMGSFGAGALAGWDCTS